MSERDRGTCVAEVEDATLSAWRDGMLPPAERARIDDHVSHCAACQARLTRYDVVERKLLRQRDLEPGDRIVEAMRGSLTHQTPKRWTPSRRAWGSASALASVAALILLFVYVLDTGPLGHPRPRSQATAVPTATLAPTPVPTIGPSAFTPVVSLQAAWGSSAQIAQLSTQLDATHVFEAYTTTPDGHKLLGGMRVTGPGGPASYTIQAGILDVATRQFTPVGDPMPDQGGMASAFCRYSDGRFVVCADQPAATHLHAGINPEPTITLWSYDLVSGQERLITDSSKYPFVGYEWLSHGLLMLSTETQVGIVNLATNTLSPLSLPPRRPIPIGFSWPYLVYFDWSNPPTPLKVRAHNLATGEDVALPQVDAMYAATYNADANLQPYLVLTGDTLFVSLATGRIQSSNVPPNNVTGPDAATTLYELDHLFASGARLRPVARYHGDASGLVGANDRLVLCGGAVAWDRAQDRFVKFPSLPNNLVPLTALTGNALMLASYPPPEQVTIYDTARLPTTGG